MGECGCGDDVMARLYKLPDMSGIEVIIWPTACDLCDGPAMMHIRYLSKDDVERIDDMGMYYEIKELGEFAEVIFLDEGIL